jgi:hypothetical protein
MPEEMRFMMRSAVYSIFIGIVYWFVSYEAAGTVFLLGAGLAAGVMFGAIYYEWRQSGHRLRGPFWRWINLPPAEAESGTTDETGRLPRPTIAPISAGLGVALLALGLVFGIWMALAAIVPLVVAMRAWIKDSSAEYRAVEAADPAEAD